MLNKREINTWKFGMISLFEGVTPSEYDNSVENDDMIDYILYNEPPLEFNDGTTATLFKTFRGEIIALEDQEC